MRSSVQYSLVCSASSDAKSSSGRNHGPASRRDDGEPGLGQPAGERAAAGTGADDDESRPLRRARYSRIGTQPPGGTHRARGRPCRAARPADHPTRRFSRRAAASSPSRASAASQGSRRSISHAHIAARARRTAPADLAPGRGMRPIGMHDVVQQALLEERRRRHPAPGAVMRIARCIALQHAILPRAIERVKCGPVQRPRLGVERAQPTPPCLALRAACRQRGSRRGARASACRRPAPLPGSAGDAPAAARCAPAIASSVLNSSAVKNRGSREHGETLIDHAPRLRVPRRRLALREHVVAGIALSHRDDRRADPSAASPARARPVKLGGAGIGGPFSRFWRQLRQPPMLRCTP